MASAFYRVGTVAVTRNSKVVTGTGTNWSTGVNKPLAGDVFVLNNKIYEIEHVISNTEIRLYRNFEDANAAAQTYVIMRNASLNISSRIAAQVAQVVNQKQVMLDEFHNFLTNDTDPKVNLTDTLGNQIPVTPIPMLDASHNQAIKDLNDKADEVTSSQILMNESEAMAIANDRMRNMPSGMVHMGKTYNRAGYSATNINEGMFVVEGAAYANKVCLGKTGSTYEFGDSKTNFAVSHIAGAITEILYLNRTAAVGGYQPESVLDLPPAPKGYDVFDSSGDCRGTGKATLNLRTEVDPKYGDIASTDSEAISRAFEGDFEDGDNRTGDTGRWTSINGGTVSISGGAITINCPVTSAGAYIPNVGFPYSQGELIVMEIEILSVTGTGDFKIQAGNGASGGSNDAAILFTEPGVYKETLTWNSQDTGAPQQFFAVSGTGVGSFEVGSISVRKVTEEVVTHPVDTCFFEQFDMEGTEIFPNVIQYTSNTFKGIPLTLSKKKLSFFQAFTGQFPEVTANPDFINDRYYCLDWTKATEAQKRSMAAALKDNLYNGDNNIPVGRYIRYRAVRGAGNGDWFSTDSNAFSSSNYSSYLQYGNNNSRVAPQGTSETLPSNNWGYPIYVGSIGHEKTDLSCQGAFSANKSTGTPADNFAYKGRCYAYVIGKVPRFNQGAYHETLNPWGTDFTQGTDNLAKKWYDSAAKPLNTEADCFKRDNKGSSTVEFGSIGSGGSGRPDGGFYDGIRASGLGGFNDDRTPARDIREFADDALSRIEAGKYRGEEKLVWTEFLACSDNGGSTAVIYSTDLKGRTPVAGTSVYLLRPDGSGEVIGKVRAKTTSSPNAIDLHSVTTRGVTGDLYLVSVETDTSVSGEFTMTNIIADPAEWLATPAIAGGVLGEWIPVIPDGTSKAYTMTKQLIGDTPSRVLTHDNGATWAYAATTPSFNASTNSYTYAELSTLVQLTQYTAYAAQVVEDVSRSVLDERKGVKEVRTHNGNYSLGWGALLMEGLIGKIGVNANSTSLREILSITNLCINTDGQINQNSSNPTVHSPISMTAPNNDSPAVKYLPYLFEDNGAGNFGFQANELTWGTPTFTSVPESNTTWTNGVYYRVTDGAYKGFYLATSNSSVGINHQDRVKGSDMSIYSATSGVKVLEWIGYLDSSWGDDGKIKVTAKGSDTFVDRNGNTNISRVSRLTKRLGYVVNKAKVGESS